MLGSFVLWSTMSATAMIAAMVMATVWRMNPTVPGVREWTLGLLVSAIGIFLTAARDMGLPLPLSVMFGNAFLVIGLYYEWKGALQFLGKKKPKTDYIFAAYCAVYVLALLYFTIVEENFLLRVSIVSVSILFFDAISFYVFLPRKGERQFLTHSVILVAYGTHGLIFLVRTIWALALVMDVPLHGFPLIMTVASLFSIATPVFLAMGFLAISNEFLMNELKAQAAHDPLTGVYNRRAFFTIANHVWKRRERNHQTVSVITLDLDHFKAVNDTYGHKIGDQALRHVVHVVQGVLRKDDLLARFGGEEFVILLADADRIEAQAVAERVRQAVETMPLPMVRGPALTITASLGLATVLPGDQASSVADLIEWADDALYRAKTEGRNRVCVADVTRPVEGRAVRQAGE